MTDNHPANNKGSITDTIRPKDNRMVAGVCAGLARRYNWDVNLVRLLWVVAALSASIGFWLYIVAWIVFPEEGSNARGGDTFMRNIDNTQARNQRSNEFNPYED